MFNFKPDDFRYRWMVAMATNPRIANNPFNKPNIEWYKAECKRIESIRKTNAS